ncbi:MAG: hypothetical protein HKP55_05285 [Gammaproteobacteria bacterium]|nr:hypothetical protein [Gammaproteobacteria bacterium]
MKRNAFLSPRYLILSVVETSLIVLAIFGYVKMDFSGFYGEGFHNFLLGNWLALAIAAGIIMLLNTFVTMKEHMENSTNKPSDL